MNKPALEIVQHSYLEYAKYVNSTRSLVDARDGLKTVQRRILVTCKGINKKAKCAQIVGECMAKYHPHGDASVYGALVTLVRSQVSLLEGQGSFGSQGDDDGAAAMRYTGAQLNSFGNIFLELSDLAPKHRNDLGNYEPDYIPTPLPYALLAGTRGIGVGVVSSIPPCSIQSMADHLKNPKSPIVPIPLGQGNISVSNSELEKFNKEGRFSAIISADVKWEYHKDEGKQVIVIENIPLYININAAGLALREEVAEGLIYVRDESTDKPRIVIARRSRIRKISDDDLFKKIKRAYTKTVSFCNYVWDDGIIRIITPGEFLNKSFDLALKVTKGKIEGQLDKVMRDIKFENVKGDLSKLLLQGQSKEYVVIKLSLTNEEFDDFSGRAITALKKMKDMAGLNKMKDTYTEQLSNVRSYYMKYKMKEFIKGAA